MPTVDVKEWLHHWQDEADAAYLYLALAGQESDPHRKDVYIKLAGVEERHTQMWTKLLAEHGHTVDRARPSLNAKLRAGFGRRFGTRYLLPMLLREEGEVLVMADAQGKEVRVPVNLASGFSWDQADLTIKHPRSKWIAFGVTYPDGRPLPSDDLPASLLLPMGRTGPAFLAYPNFAAYTEWNNSLIYSTTAGYLATRIAGAAPMRQPTAPVVQLPFNEIKELQQLLVRAGFNVGKVDGLLGQQSRIAVKTMQVKYGLPADSWPTAELLARMRGAPR